MIVCGILAFFIIERLMHIFGLSHSHAVKDEHENEVKVMPDIKVEKIQG